MDAHARSSIYCRLCKLKLKPVPIIGMIKATGSVSCAIFFILKLSQISGRQYFSNLDVISRDV